MHRSITLVIMPIFPIRNLKTQEMKHKKLAYVSLCLATLSLIAAIAMVLWSAHSQGDENSPIAMTQTGPVKGESRDGVAIFRGIPYGDACDGDARWKAPAPAKAWKDVLDCTENGPIAVQNGGSISTDSVGLGAVFNGGHPELFKCQQEVQSENCLVLDVVTPGIDKNARPVVVYIHGGGFTTGSGSLVLGSDRFAREEDIVVVGINHRLNAFGYLYLGGLDSEYVASGSVGIQDLVLALEWVRDNISSFGGDPSQVTIMGESGGAMKICTLLSMPSAQGLFSKAIIESGANAAGTYTQGDAEVVTNRFLANLGLTKDNWKDIFTMDASKLLAATVGLNFSPVADGHVIPYSEAGDWAPEISKDIPVMVGASADEMGVFTPVNEFAQNITWDNIAERVVAANPTLTIKDAEKIVWNFRYVDCKNDEAWHTYLKIISCTGFLGSGANNLAEARTKAGFAPVYQYFVEYDALHPLFPELRCAWHTADLPLQFRIVLHPECEELSQTMARAWGAFIRTGNPSTEELEWPEFTIAGKQFMVFDEKSEVRRDPILETR